MDWRDCVWQFPEDGTKRPTTMEHTKVHVEQPPKLDRPDHANKTTGCWKHEGNKWTRHRTIPRLKLYEHTPTFDGPGVEKLANARLTKQTLGATTTPIQNNWRAPTRTENHQNAGPTLNTRTGTTTFTEATEHP